MENERVNSEIMAVDRPWVIRALARMEDAGKPAWARAGAVLMLREVREVRGTLCPVPEGVTHEELDRRIDAVASEVAVSMELDKMRAAGEALVRRAQEAARLRSEAPPLAVSHEPVTGTGTGEVDIDFGSTAPSSSGAKAPVEGAGLSASASPPPAHADEAPPAGASSASGHAAPLKRADEPAPQGEDPGFVDGDALEPNDGGDTRSSDLPPTP